MSVQGQDDTDWARQCCNNNTKKGGDGRLSQGTEMLCGDSVRSGRKRRVDARGVRQ